MTKSEKPHYGRIKDWYRDGDVIRGVFLDHPYHRGEGHTSLVLHHDGATGEIETKNSRYTLVKEGEPSRFQDFPIRGDRMKFLNANGYDSQREAAEKVFDMNKIYTVTGCVVEPWDHWVSFQDIPGVWNGVMFQRVFD